MYIKHGILLNLIALLLSVSSFNTCNTLVTPPGVPHRPGTLVLRWRPGRSYPLFSQLSDPTSLFNNDIYRIASRTKSRNSNFNPIHAAERAEVMLLQMISLYKSSNRKTARPNIETFQIVLMGYANLKGYRWEKRNEGGNSSFGYSSSAFTNTWGDEYMDELRSEEDIRYSFNNDELRDDEKDGEISIQHGKDDSTVTCAADRVDFILEQLHQLQMSEKEAGNDISTLQLNTDICNFCLLSYARCSHPQNNEITHGDNQDNSIIDQQQCPFLLPVSQRGSYGERAEHLVKYMQYLSKQSDGPKFDVEPNAQTFSYLIWTLSKQQPDTRRGQRKFDVGNKDVNNKYATRSSEWLPHLEALYQNYESKEGEYNPKKRLLRMYVYWAYSDILDAWCKCSAKKSPRKVYKYMTMIESLCEEDKAELYSVQCEGDIIAREEEDDDVYYNNKSIDERSFPNSWSTSLKPPSTDDYEPKLDPNIPLYPSSQSYTQTILSLSKSKEQGSAQRANEILYKMLDIYDSGEWGKNKPGVYAFNGVISAWANCASGEIGNSEKAEQLLNLMEKLYFDKDKPEYNHLKPDSITYNTAIKAWTNSKEDASILKAEKLMERMEKRFNAIGDKFLDVKPDSYTYNTMITGWLRSDLGITSAQNAENLLRKMVEKYLHGHNELQPHQKIFSSIIDKWAKSDPSKNVAVKHSIDLLNLMESLYEGGCSQLKPDKITYTNIIDAIARSRSPTGAPMALSLLETMEKKYNDGDVNIKPSAQTYSCVLLSLLNSNMEDKHIVAQKIPKRMEEIGVTPNAFTWNYLIHVASSVVGSEEKRMDAFKVALNGFQTLRKSEAHNTDSFTYTFFLKAIKHLMSPSVMRSSIARETFLECVNEGKVNDQVLSRLVWAMPPEEVRDILGSIRISDIRKIKARDLPPEWGRNVYNKGGR